MGVKEYRFLTRTMKTITTRSNKIAKAKERLSGYEDKLKDFRKRASRLRANEKKDILHLKDGEALVKEEIANLEAKRKPFGTHHEKEWGSAEYLKKEVEAAEAEYKRKTFWFDSNSLFYSGGGLKQRLKELKKRERLVKKDERDRSKIGKQIAKLDKRLSKIDSELKNPKKKKEISGLETKIKKLVKLRGSTKKEIKLLEKDIPQLWDSIAHLIPFSTALEKA